MIALVLAAALVIPPVQKDGIELRFVEAGSFRFSEVQGAEMDLVNAGENPVTCAVKLVLRRPDASTDDWKEIQKTEAAAIILPAHSRAGFRVKEPLVCGRRRVEYEVLVQGQPFARSQFEFTATGPYEVFLRPFFLLREGVYVRVVGRAAGRASGGERISPEKYRFKLVNPRSGAVLAQSDEFRVCKDTEAIGDVPPRPIVEGFLSFKGQPPGEYRIEVEVRSPEGAPLTTVWLAIKTEPLQ